jgi:hypothetical protein
MARKGLLVRILDLERVGRSAGPAVQLEIVRHPSRIYDTGIRVNLKRNESCTPFGRLSSV